MGFSVPAGLLYWYTTSACLGLLTIISIISKLHAFKYRTQDSTKPTPSTRAEYDTEKLSPISITRIHGGNQGRLVNAAFTIWTKYIRLSELPIPKIQWLRRHTRTIAASELGWTLGYTVGVLVLSFIGTARDVKSWSNQTGWMAIAQIPLIIALAGKNNLISLLTGISYERLNFLHRAAGRVCLLGAWLHAIGYCYLLGGISLIQIRTSLTTWGMTSILSFSCMYLLSVRWVRQRVYEFFLVAHVCLAALFLAGVIMHWHAVDIWIYPGIALWAADRLLRLTRLFLPSLSTSTSFKSEGTLTLLTPSTLKLTLPTKISWKAGQHFYVHLPTLSKLPWETHPFTAATIPTNSSKEGEVSFIIRVRDGMTARMKASVEASGVESAVKGRVEGPYGYTQCLRNVDGLVIFAGGSGISFAVSHVLQIVADAKAGKTACHDVRIVWMVKSKLHLNWIQPLLLPALLNIPSNLNIKFHIHVTKRSAPTLSLQSGLPSHPGEIGTGDWQTYMEERAAAPARRMSRKMSTMSWATFGGPGAGDGSGLVTGPGTRRGSEAVILPIEDWDKKKSTKDGLIIDPVLANEAVGPKGEHANTAGAVVPTFTWTDGYGGLTLPAETYTPAMPPRRQIRRSSGPLSPVHRARFHSIDPSTYPSSSSPTSPLGPRGMKTPSRSSFDSSDDGASIRSRERRVSFADDIPPTTPTRSRSSFDHAVVSLPKSPVDRNLSSVKGDSSHGRRASSPRTPTTPGGMRKSSLAIVSTLPDDDADDDKDEQDFKTELNDLKLSHTVHTLEAYTPTDLQYSLSTNGRIDGNTNFSRPVPEIEPASALLPPVFSNEMTRSFSGDSFTSFASFTADRPSESGLNTPVHPIPPPSRRLDGAGPTNEVQDLDPHKQILTGMEQFVKWHEGRADPQQIIRRLKRDVGVGRVEVMVCGPASLLAAVKKASREEMDVREVWEGGVSVGFHAEEFGW